MTEEELRETLRRIRSGSIDAEQEIWDAWKSGAFAPKSEDLPPVSEGEPAKSDLQEALGGLIQIIEAAGLYQLSTGVELGPTVWYVKASDALTYAKDVLAVSSTERGE